MNKKVQETPITEGGLIGIGFVEINTVSKKHGWVTNYHIEDSLLWVKEYDFHHKKCFELYAADVYLRRVTTVEQVKHILDILTEA